MHKIFLTMISISFFLLLRKSVYPYEYTDDWEKFNEKLPEKGDFYSHLNMEDIADPHYAHAKRVCKDFEKSRKISCFLCSRRYFIVS